MGICKDFSQTFLITYTFLIPNHFSIHKTLKMETAKCIDLIHCHLCKTALKSSELSIVITYYLYIDFYKGSQESIRGLRVTLRQLGVSSGMRRRVVTYLPDDTWSHHDRRQPSAKECLFCHRLGFIYRQATLTLLLHGAQCRTVKYCMKNCIFEIIIFHQKMCQH